MAAKRKSKRSTKAKKPCPVPGCDRKAIARGICHNHWRKANREGRLDAIVSTDAVMRHYALKALSLDGRSARSK